MLKNVTSIVKGEQKHFHSFIRVGILRLNFTILYEKKGVVILLEIS